MVGTQVARRLAERFGRLDRIIAAGASNLAAVPGMGPHRARRLLTMARPPPAARYTPPR
jgi:NAD-dependent DNA ligase